MDQYLVALLFNLIISQFWPQTCFGGLWLVLESTILHEFFFWISVAFTREYRCIRSECIRRCKCIQGIIIKSNLVQELIVFFLLLLDLRHVGFLKQFGYFAAIHACDLRRFRKVLLLSSLISCLSYRVTIRSKTWSAWFCLVILKYRIHPETQTHSLCCFLNRLRIVVCDRFLLNFRALRTLISSYGLWSEDRRVQDIKRWRVNFISGYKKFFPILFLSCQSDICKFHSIKDGFIHLKLLVHYDLLFFGSCCIYNRWAFADNMLYNWTMYFNVCTD